MLPWTVKDFALPFIKNQDTTLDETVEKVSLLTLLCVQSFTLS